MRRHLLIMVICCAIPLGLIFALPYIGTSLGGWYGVILLLCPLIHFLMMTKKGGHRH